MRVRRWLIVGVMLLGAGVALADPRRPQRSTSSTTSRPTTPAGYFYTVRAWHTPDPNGVLLRDINNRPVFVIHAIALNETITLQAQNDRGGFSSVDLARAMHTVRESSTGNEHPIDAHTLDVLYQIQVHFNAQEIRVLSAYRTPKPGNGQGNHGRGRAVDFALPGVGDSDVGRYVREHGFVGVGVYPNAGFVHVDVRPRSYFWIDTSGPGLPSREKGILIELGFRSDALALQRGEQAPPPFLSDGGLPEEDEDEDM